MRGADATSQPTLSVGERVVVEVERVAHGGHCVARYVPTATQGSGQVLFVRHALPGERVLVEVTSLGPQSRYVFADAIEVLHASAGRRVPPCPAYHPGGCGGCDWLHATPELSRELKTAVVREAFARFGSADAAEQVANLEVEVIAPADLGWRTRANLAVDAAGHAGLRRHHSHEVVRLSGCPQLVDPSAAGAFGRGWRASDQVRFVASWLGANSTETVAWAASEAAAQVVGEQVGGRQFEVAGDGFWQAHRGAPAALVGEVLRHVVPAATGPVVDLYAGVGLFGLSLLDATAGAVPVTLVEGDRRAAGCARHNAAGAARVVAAPVEKWLRGSDALAGVAAVILDPPRAGAGRAVLTTIAAARPGLICYVACDPVALARDSAILERVGYQLASLRAFDLFPSTHHIESVAAFRPRSL